MVWCVCACVHGCVDGCVGYVSVVVCENLSNVYVFFTVRACSCVCVCGERLCVCVCEECV